MEAGHIGREYLGDTVACSEGMSASIAWCSRGCRVVCICIINKGPPILRPPLPPYPASSPPLDARAVLTLLVCPCHGSVRPRYRRRQSRLRRLARSSPFMFLCPFSRDSGPWPSLRKLNP